MLDMLQAAVIAHSIPATKWGECVLLPEHDIRLYTVVDQQAQRGDTWIAQTSFAVQAPLLGDRVLWQQFAGFGTSEIEAEKDGFSKFLVGPFHVVLSALAGHSCEVDTWETWRGASGDWAVSESPLITHNAPDPTAVPYAEVLEGLQHAFLKSSTSADRRPHWIDVFVAFLDDATDTAQVLLDGEPWDDGQMIVDAWRYQPGTGGYQSVRHFLIAMPEHSPSP